MNEPGTHERLITATQALLWERGYAATSPRAILEHAGVGQGSMYHHFDGKQALARAALERNADAVVAKASAVLSGASSPLSRLIGYLHLQRQVLLGCPVGRMAADADAIATPALHTVLESAFERVRQLVVAATIDAVAAGELPTDVDAQDFAETVLAVVQGGYVLARAAGDPSPFDRAVRGAVALIERAARGDRS